MLPKVTVIVLNYKRPLDTLACVRSVLESDYPHFDLLILDNGSGDGSAQTLAEAYPALKVIGFLENLGYAGGNNAGIRQAFQSGADYVLVLNNDTLMKPDALRLLVEAAEREPRATIVAPKVNYEDRRTVVNSYGTSMDWLRLRPYLGDCDQPDDGRFEGERDVEIIPGAALLFRKTLLKQIGLFEENFFLIHEDADLCYRNRKAGFLNRVVGAAVIYHKVSRTLSAYPEASEYYSIRNFLYLAEAHASCGERFKTAAGVLGLGLKKAVLFLFCSEKRPRLRGFFRGVAGYLRRETGHMR